MKDFLDSIFTISFICGFMFMIGAGVLYFFPPKRINSWFAYRTAAAIKTQERWDFAQKFAAVQIIRASVVMIILSLAGYLFPHSGFLHVFGSIALITAWERYIVKTTDMELKKRFTKIKQ
jgi:hypothetical protein